MNLSWLLFKKSGRQSIGRLSLTSAAIALGVVILLSLVAVTNGLMSRAESAGWKVSVYNASKDKELQKPTHGEAPLKISEVGSLGNITKWQDKTVEETALYAEPTTTLTLDGLKNPAPGEYYLSEALAKINREHPEAKIGDRFGTKYLGTIPAKYSQSPDDLSVIRGASREEAFSKDAYGKNLFIDMYSFGSNNDVKNQIGITTTILLSFGGTILLFPIVMFVAIATQLGSAQREQRYAAIRLVGGTRSQVTKMLLFESFIASLAGVIIGSLIHLATLPLLREFRFNDLRFIPDTVAVHWDQYFWMIGLTLVLSMLANWWGMRHVQLSPLGVARKQKTAKKPRMWRVLPLLVGVGVFVWMSLPQGREWIKNTSSQDPTPMYIIMVGVFLVMFGLVLAGSWLTYRIAKLSARRTKRPSMLIAGRRISVQYKQVFRAVSGVVLALFAGSFYLAAVGGVDKLNADSVNDNGYSQLNKTAALVELSNPNEKDLTELLRAQSFVKSADKITQVDSEDGSMSYIPCGIANTYTRHSCPDNKQFAQINFMSKVVKTPATTDEITGDKRTSGYLVQLKDTASVEQLRSFIATNTVAMGGGQSLYRYVAVGEYAQQPHINPVIKSFAEMAYGGIGLTMFVAVCSMIVSTIGGLLERRRSLLTLRLSGMTLTQMKRVVLIESLIPLFAVSILAAGLGVWVANVFLTPLSSSVKATLTPTYFLIVGGLLLAAVIGIYRILPMIKKITSLEENRTE